MFKAEPKLLAALETNCRTCLKSSDLVYLTEITLINIIKECTSVKNLTFEEPNIPICQRCKTTLNNFFEFKHRLEEVDRLFLSYDPALVKADDFSPFTPTYNADEPNDLIQKPPEKSKESVKEELNDILSTHLGNSLNSPESDNVNLDETTDKDSKEVKKLHVKLCKYCQRVCKTSRELRSHFCPPYAQLFDKPKRKKDLQCDICDKKFTRLRYLRQHKLMIHDQLRPYKCVNCDKSYSILNVLVRHVKLTHADATTVDCDKCAEKFHVQAQLDKHKARVHYDNKCPHCGKIYNKLKNMKDHISNVHKIRVPMFHCAECDRSFTKAQVYEQHLKCHKGEDLRKMCNICGKKYRNVNDHVNSVHRKGEVIYKCRKCGITHMDIVSSRKHAKTHRTPVAENDVRYKYACTECPRKYMTKLNLTRHWKITHENVLRFSCETCNKHYKQKKDYVVHMRRHTGERPFECDTCKMAFTNRDTLKAHIRTHTGERPYACQVCNERFMHSIALKRHVKKHSAVTDTKPFKAPMFSTV